MSGRWILVLFTLLIGALVVSEALRPRPLDLRVRLEREGSAPFDAEVFYAALPGWLGQPVMPVAEAPFDRLDDSTVTGRTYLFLTAAFEPDEAEAERLLRFVARGNTVALATRRLAGPFGEALGVVSDSSADGSTGLRVAQRFDGSVVLGAGAEPDSLRLASPGVAGWYGLPVAVRGSIVRGLDLSRSQILGTGPHGVTLVRVAHGEGEVLVSSTPLAFSNAALTGAGEAEGYVGGVLAALPRQPLWWDDAYKPFREQARTPLRYVLRTPPLRWAYGLAALALVLFVAFRGRRWQRAVPVVEPPPNAQREFARTIGRLHLAHGDDRRLVRRKTRVFLDRLWTDLRVADPDLTDATARRAAARAGVPEHEATALFATLDRLGRAPTAADADTLVRLDARIDRFFRHTDPHGEPAA